MTLHLTGVSADLDTAMTMVDALELMGVDVHATCLGTISGAAVAILAVADRRTAGSHATVHLREPHPPHNMAGRDLETHADHYERQLRRLQHRIAQACHRPIDAVAADMRAHRVMTAEQAREYGLIDSFDRQGSRAGSGVDTTAVPPTAPPDPKCDTTMPKTSVVHASRPPTDPTDSATPGKGRSGLFGFLSTSATLTRFGISGYSKIGSRLGQSPIISLRAATSSTQSSLNREFDMG